MISDVLFNAASEMRRYLTDETFNDVYVGLERAELQALLVLMDAMRQRLDTPSPELFQAKQNVRPNT